MSLLLFLFSTFGADRRIDASHLTIAAYNVQFLFDGKLPEGRASFQWKSDTAVAQNHMRNIAGVIRKLDADVLMLVEVEHVEVLREMNHRYLSGMGYRAYLVKGRDFVTRQNVGILTRIDPAKPLKRSKMRFTDAQGYSRGVSKHVIADFVVNGTCIKMIGAHLISRIRNNDAYRNAQAIILKQLIRSRSSKCECVVLGDFNAYDPDIPDRNDSKPSSKVLRFLKDIKFKVEGNEMASVAKFVSKAKRYTNWYDRNRNGSIDSTTELSMIDHLLLSQGLASKMEAAGIFNQDYDPKRFSDHYPVWVRLRMK